MSPMHQPLDKASGQQARGASRVTWCLRLLVLAGLWLYLPLEALDADADMGFEEAVPQRGDSVCLSGTPDTPLPASPTGPPIWRASFSLTLAAAALLPPALHTAAGH